MLALAALATCAGLAVQAGAAQAETLKLTFDDGRVNLGDQKGLHMIDPGVPDPPAVLTATYAPGTGAFTAPELGLVFPPKTIEDVDSGLGFDLDVVADFAAISPISGNFNQTTGALDTQVLTVRALISLYPADADQSDPENLLARCRVSPVPIPIDSTGQIVDDTDTENPITYEAAPFAPPSGEGAGVATWSSLPVSTSDGGALAGFACGDGTTPGAVDDLIGGPGGIWLSGTAEVLPGTPDADGDGVPDDVDQCPNQVGPASNNGCPLSAPVLGITVTPKRQATKPGRAKVFTARVRNRGQAPANGVRVCVKAPKPLKGKRCKQIGTLNGGASAVRRFRLRPTRRAAGKRYVLRFRVTATNAAAKTATARLRVRRR